MCMQQSNGQIICGTCRPDVCWQTQRQCLFPNSYLVKDANTFFSHLNQKHVKINDEFSPCVELWWLVLKYLSFSTDVNLKKSEEEEKPPDPCRPLNNAISDGWSTVDGTISGWDWMEWVLLLGFVDFDLFFFKPFNRAHHFSSVTLTKRFGLIWVMWVVFKPPARPT